MNGWHVVIVCDTVMICLIAIVHDFFDGKGSDE